MKVGFTGTRSGMTARQMLALAKFLGQYQSRITEFHHGDCVGADAEAHEIVESFLGVNVIYVHPPNDERYRAFKHSPHIAEPRGYLVRNHDIVNSVDRMLAAPKQIECPSNLRGQGTWATIVYAEKHRKQIEILES